MPDLTLANARIVLPDGVVHGAVRVAGGRVAGVDAGSAVPRGAVDCEGDLVCPGLVELHTDNLERHLEPRAAVDWPHDGAILAHDAELAGVGITTVFDALRVGMTPSAPAAGPLRDARALCGAIAALRAAGALRIDHRLHLRAEICSETLPADLAAFGPADGIGILSLMDHTPGQRQFRDVGRPRLYLVGRRGMAAEAFEGHVAWLVALRAARGARHRAEAVAAARRLGAILASHDDTTLAEVAESAAAGALLAEFPTTLAAARACRAAGIAVMAGAPNLIRGASHSGNVAVAALAGEGLVDILSSDYVPAALLAGALRLADLWGDLARGLATVTAAPAAAAGLADRGRIAPGARADLIRFARVAGLPVVRGVWVLGRRVA